MLLKRLIGFYILFILAITGYSQDIKFDHLTYKQGLINNSVTAILKDSDGFMWFGTFTGLCRYDGYSFKQIIPDTRNQADFKDHYINCLYESPDKKIYIGFLWGGMCIYDKKHNSYEFYSHDAAQPTSISSNVVNCIHGDKQGNIWIGTNNGLDKFNIEKRTFSHCLPTSNKIINNYINSIAEDPQGNLWMYGLGNKVCKFNPRMNTFEYTQFSNSLGLNTTADHGGEIAYDRMGNLWVSNELDGLTHFNIGNGSKEVFSKQNGRLKSNIITSITEMSDGAIWIGTDGTGLYIYNYEDSLIKRYHSNPLDKTSLSSEGVYCIHESQPGIVWVGNYSTGLNIYKRDKKKFETFTTKGEEGKRLNNKSVLSLSLAKDGNIWLGTDGGGLNLFNPDKSTFQYFTTSNSTLCGNVIKCIATDENNTLWCGHYRDGLCKFDPNSGKSIHYTPDTAQPARSIGENSVWSLNKGTDGQLWIGLLTKGFNIKNDSANTFKINPCSYEMKGKFASGNTQVIFEDNQKRTWIGTEMFGAVCYTKGNNKYEWFDQKNSNLLSNDIQNIFQDREGYIWFGTQKGGLCKLVNQQNKTFHIYSVESGLPSNNIRKILEDTKGNLWMSTDKGISTYNKSQNYFINFDVDDGLQSNDFNLGAGLKTPEGYMYFGGIDGLNRFHPDSIRFNTEPPKVVITDFKIFHKSIQANEEYNGNIYLDKDITVADEINLSYKDYVFSIEFSALNFISPSGNKFAYMLEGFSNQWTYAQADKRIATYTNLDPGTYVFKVIASNNDGIWNRKGVQLKIIVTPPWWKTWVFRSIIIILMLGIVIFIFYYRERTGQQQNKILEKEVRKRTLELEEKNELILEKNKILEESNFQKNKQTNRILLQQQEIMKQKDALENSNKTKDKFFSIIGNDLRNPVNTLSVLMKKLKEESHKYQDQSYQELMFHAEHSTIRIQNLTLNLLDWAKTQSGNFMVSPANITVKNLVQDNLELIKQQASAKKINIISEINPEINLVADYNMISTVIRNILSNSIKFTKEGGCIEVSAASETNKVQISIKDSGVGMPEEIQKKLFKADQTISMKGTNNEKGTGLGLLIAREFMQLNQGKIDVESTLGKGTIFYLIFEY